MQRRPPRPSAPGEESELAAPPSLIAGALSRARVRLPLFDHAVLVQAILNRPDADIEHLRRSYRRPVHRLECLQNRVLFDAPVRNAPRADDRRP